jgi:hypothetical protein
MGEDEVREPDPELDAGLGSINGMILNPPPQAIGKGSRDPKAPPPPPRAVRGPLEPFAMPCAR